MHDIFISYAREDRERAERIARAFESCGWSVWWDRSIPAGRTFDEVIEEAIDGARCVVVLWSEASVDSHWVRAEAQEGRDRGVLVPILIEDVRVPLAFRRVQAADLVGWNGRSSAPAFARLRGDIEAVLAAGRTPAIPPERARERRPGDEPQSWLRRRPRLRAGVWAALVAGVASALLGLMIYRGDDRDFVDPFSSALLVGAVAGASWGVVGLVAGPGRATWTAALIGSVLGLATWIGVGGTYADVLAAAVVVGAPAGGLLGALAGRFVPDHVQGRGADALPSSRHAP